MLFPEVHRQAPSFGQRSQSINHPPSDFPRQLSTMIPNVTTCIDLRSARRLASCSRTRVTPRSSSDVLPNAPCCTQPRQANLTNKINDSLRRTTVHSYMSLLPPAKPNISRPVDLTPSPLAKLKTSAHCMTCSCVTARSRFAADMPPCALLLIGCFRFHMNRFHWNINSCTNLSSIRCAPHTVSA